jgi:hypothetical protein
MTLVRQCRGVPLAYEKAWSAYDHWLAALDHLVTAKGLADRASLFARKAAWAEAYRRTPHGKPVDLEATSG